MTAEPHTSHQPLSKFPQRGLVIVTCMDARIDPLALLGLTLGDAHVLRNPGGVVTDDVLFGIVVSQRRAQTTEVAVIQHTECAIHDLDTKGLAEEISTQTGRPPQLALRSFSDVDDSVRASLQRLRTCPDLPHRTRLTGYVYNVADGSLRTVMERSTPTIEM